MNAENIKDEIYRKVVNVNKNDALPTFLILDHETHYKLRAECEPTRDVYDYKEEKYMNMRIALCRLREDEQYIIEVK